MASIRDELYEFVKQIPLGRVTSYGEAGRSLGRQVSGKIVGAWMASAPPDVPWWRVAGKDGSLYTSRRDSALGAQQRALLEREGVPFDGDRVAMDGVRWCPDD